MPRVNTPERFWSLVRPAGALDETVCWLWPLRTDDGGYGRLGFGGRGGQKAHRVAWELVHGSIPDGMRVLHKCDNPPCCNPTHLFLGSQQDNIADRQAKGRTVDPPSRRKLTTEQVAAMRCAWRDLPVTQQMLADRYGVSRGNVSKILAGKSYPDA
jgi:hypothetical protein